MAHFAQIDENSVVTQVLVVNNETLNNQPFPDSEPLGVAFLQGILGADTRWVQTSYNGSFRKRFAGIGFTYSDALDAFIAPQPYPSWILNFETCDWEAPFPYPDDGGVYVWNESTLSWVIYDATSPV